MENNEILGNVKAVSLKNYGVLVGEQWYNAHEKAREFVKADLKGQWIGVSLSPENAREIIAIRYLDEDEIRDMADTLIEQAEQPRAEVKENGRILLQGKEYVTHEGLLSKAHEMGMLSIVTEPQTIQLDKSHAFFKATVLMPQGKVFTAFGDAGVDNLTPMMLKSFIRMAETRAINRCLRLATNIGTCSVDELPDGEK